MANQIDATDVFERPMSYPDVEAMERFGRLVGIAEQKARLTKTLSVLIHPAGLRGWVEQHHPAAHRMVELVLRRPPLVILAGDVGCGKTELAETVGDAVARQERIAITLLPLSLAARGQGRVGEMTQLLSAAFDYAVREAGKQDASRDRPRAGVILLVDEADALTQSRETAQMHHEDRAGVNAFIRGIDRIANSNCAAAVIMCTNRINAIDPAVRRRAADILTFGRPDEAQRREVLSRSLTDAGFSSAAIDALVAATGPQEGRAYGFTFSDLVQRLLPAVLLDAYPDRPLDPVRALEISKTIPPTPPFEENKTL